MWANPKNVDFFYKYIKKQKLALDEVQNLAVSYADYLAIAKQLFSCFPTENYLSVLLHKTCLKF